MGTDSDQRWRISEIAVDLYNFAELLRARGRAGEAREQHAKAAEIARLFLLEETKNTDPRLRRIVEKWEALVPARARPSVATAPSSPTATG